MLGKLCCLQAQWKSENLHVMLKDHLHDLAAPKRSPRTGPRFLGSMPQTSRTKLAIGDIQILHTRLHSSEVGRDYHSLAAYTFSAYELTSTAL
jgi:hypothetical protein